MCEFCTKHGEGKKWYLQMKNYSEELRHARLSLAQRKYINLPTRAAWLERFFSGFVLGTSGRAELPESAAPQSKPKAMRPPTEAEIVKESQVVHFGQVLPIEDCEAVIDLVDSITRLPCGCRLMTTGKADQRYCFGVGIDTWGILGKFPNGSFEVLNKREAKRLFREYDREGLIHSVWTGVTPYVVGLCNCDHDCAAYRGYIEKNGPPNFFRAEYVAQVDWNLCTGCKSCMRQCQFGSMFYSSALARVHIDPVRCFGCGVCRAACKKDAISLMPRQKEPKAANIWLRPPVKTA